MTRREMQPVSVEIGNEGKIVLTQAVYDINGDADPRIELTFEQTPLVATWLMEAAGEAAKSIGNDDVRPIPVRYFVSGQ